MVRKILFFSIISLSTLVSLFVYLILIWGVVQLSSASYTSVKSKPTISVVTGTKPSVDNLLKAVNQERAKVGVAPLAIDERLNKSAQTKAQDMKARNYFGHVDPDGKHGYMYIREYAPDTCTSASENIQDSKVESDNILEADMSAWIHSPPHYAAMIDPKYNATGFGITSTGLVEHFCEL